MEEHHHYKKKLFDLVVVVVAVNWKKTMQVSRWELLIKWAPESSECLQVLVHAILTSTTTNNNGATE